MKNYFYYKDQEVKRFNHVTVVEGSLNSKIATDVLVYDAYDKVVSTYNEVWGMAYINKGVSKCSPEDKYNAKTGLIIASRKAELKLNKEALKDVTNAIKAAEEYLALLKDMEDKLDYKVNKLSLDLVAMNKGE